MSSAMLQGTHQARAGARRVTRASQHAVQDIAGQHACCSCSFERTKRHVRCCASEVGERSAMADPAELPQAPSPVDIEEAADSGKAVAIAMAKVAWDTKGEDIVVKDVAAAVSWCSYMVFVTVFSRPQLNAVLGKMEKEAREVWGRKAATNSGRSAWEVLDLGDVVVHVFGEDLREFYDLEAFYELSENIELPFLAITSREESIEWQTSQRL